MKNFSWPIAMVAFGVIVGVVVLGVAGKDAAALVSLVNMGISALLLGKLQGVENNTNGNATAQLNTIREAMRVIAVSQPPATQPDREPENTQRQ